MGPSSHIYGSIRTAAISSWASRIASRDSASFQGATIMSFVVSILWPAVFINLLMLDFGPSSSSVSAPMVTFCSSAQPWYWPSNFTIFILPVCALATRHACIFASVPELWKLTISAHGIISVSFFANLQRSSVGVENWEPFFSCSFTASLTDSGA